MINELTDNESLPPKVLEAIRQEIEDRLGKPPRRWSWFRLKSLRSSKPAWLKSDDLISDIYRNQGRIIRNGEVRWAGVVQANTTLFRPGKVDCGAQVIFAPQNDVPINHLTKFAAHIFRLKNTLPSDPAELKWAAMLTDEVERAVGWPTPPSITGMAKVVTTIIMPKRKDMPGTLLASNCFPILVDLTSSLALFVPSTFWPENLLSIWVQRADAVQQHLESQRNAVETDELPPKTPPTAVITLTPAAAAQIRSIIAEQKLGKAWLRVGVIENNDGSCLYDMKFDTNPPNPSNDTTWNCLGVSVVVDRQHVRYLQGTVIDFHNTPAARGFKFNNPNAV